MTRSALRLLCLVLGLIGAAAAQGVTPAQQSKSDPIRIAGLEGASLRLTMGKITTSVALAQDLGGCWNGTYDGSDPKSKPVKTALTPRVIDEVKKGNFWYVTLQITLGSGCNVMGLCGAGTTVNLVWLKLDAKLGLYKKQTAIVSDCLSNTNLTQWAGRTGNDVQDASDPKLELRAGILALEYEKDDYTAKKKTVFKLRYDRRTPEQGLVISSQTSALK